MKHKLHTKKGLLFFIVFILLQSGAIYGQHLVVDTDFAGGNILVNKPQVTSSLYAVLNQDTVFVRPDFRDTKGNWFYWCFRITEAGDHSHHFVFPENYIGSFGPAYSIDGGQHWQWLYDCVSTDSNHFEYRFNRNISEVRFCSVIPYLQTNFDHFISSLKGSPLIKLGTLAISEKGRQIEKVEICKSGLSPKYRVVLTARHHACESMANYVLEGIIESMVQSKDDNMKWLRDNVSFFVVPFVDKDGVEDGDQGKNRLPWDHCVDYCDSSMYKSTAAIRRQLAEWAPDGLNFVLDMHCPGLRGKWGETSYVVGAKDPKLAENQKSFLKILINENRGVLKLDSINSLIESGTAWNVFHENERTGFREWTAELSGKPYFASTIEIPYSNHNGQVVLPQSARLLGNDIANAISVFLMNSEMESH